MATRPYQQGSLVKLEGREEYVYIPPRAPKFRSNAHRADWQAWCIEDEYNKRLALGVVKGVGR